MDKDEKKTYSQIAAETAAAQAAVDAAVAADREKRKRPAAAAAATAGGGGGGGGGDDDDDDDKDDGDEMPEASSAKRGRVVPPIRQFDDCQVHGRLVTYVRPDEDQKEIADGTGLKSPEHAPVITLVVQYGGRHLMMPMPVTATALRGLLGAGADWKAADRTVNGIERNYPFRDPARVTRGTWTLSDDANGVLAVLKQDDSHMNNGIAVMVGLVGDMIDDTLIAILGRNAASAFVEGSTIPLRICLVRPRAEPRHRRRCPREGHFMPGSFMAIMCPGCYTLSGEGTDHSPFCELDRMDPRVALYTDGRGEFPLMSSYLHFPTERDIHNVMEGLLGDADSHVIVTIPDPRDDYENADLVEMDCGN
jgi:hypothetical protein